MLCDILPMSFPSGNSSAGQTHYNGSCSGCHRVADAVTYADWSKPDLRCRGAWLRQDMSTLDSDMGFTLSFQQIADLNAYFASFPNCD